MNLKQTYKQVLLIPSIRLLSQNYVTMRKLNRIIKRDEMISRDYISWVKTALAEAEKCIGVLERLEKRLKLFYKKL